jgi:uncharacterized membrane protein
MNWKTYSKLTDKQKEEWQFRFSKQPSRPYYAWFYISFSLLGFAFLLLSWLYFSKEKVPGYEDLRQYISLSGRIIIAGSFILLVEYLTWLAMLGWHFYKEYKWKRKIGI